MRSGKFGVTITRGAVPWQIFQQGPDGTAVIRLEGEYHLVHLSQELPLSFSDVPDAPATVKARVALERTGESVIPWTVCDITAPGRWTVTFPAVPAGGLYRVETYMEYEGWDGLSCTRGDMVHHIGVGDVFVIAGQSNAAGRAKGPVDDAPSQMVHVLRPSGGWDLATHPLGETTGAVHIGNYENHNPGHSPWLHFAKMLNRALGYPIGLVPTAYGGSPLRWWDPAENGALTDNMLDILADYDLHPKAVLWVQGEAEGYENSAGTYLRRFAAFVDAVRRRLGQPDLRFFTVQINRCMEGPGEVLDRQWGIVRQAQRQAAGEIPGVTVVPSTDVSLYDSIHNSAQGNLVIGERVARSALCVLYGRREIDWQAPQPLCARQTAPDTVVLTLAPVRNWVNSYGVPAALLPFDAEDEQGLVHPAAYADGTDTITLTFPRPLGPGAVLHGAWRMDPGPCIPCDCMRMPMLSFYGFPVTSGGAEKGGQP